MEMTDKLIQRLLFLQDSGCTIFLDDGKIHKIDRIELEDEDDLMNAIARFKDGGYVELWNACAEDFLVFAELKNWKDKI